MNTEVENLRARLEQVERERDVGRLREAALAQISQRINEQPLDVNGTLRVRGGSPAAGRILGGDANGGKARSDRHAGARAGAAGVA